MKNKLLLILTFTLMLLAESARAYYEPVMGRWLTRDPINEPGFRELNRIKFTFENTELRPYTFVRNRPVDLVDPAGLFDFVYWPPQVQGNCNWYHEQLCQKECFSRGKVLNKCTHGTDRFVTIIYQDPITTVWQTSYQEWLDCSCIDPRSCPPPTGGAGRGRNNPPPLTFTW